MGGRRPSAQGGPCSRAHGRDRSASCGNDQVPQHASSSDLVALDDALRELAKRDERQSQIIELRFFGGLTVEETALVLKVAPDTVMRDSRLAKAWLARELASSRAPRAN